MDYQQIIDNSFDDFIENLKTIVRIPSVNNKDKSGKPFGLAVDRALKEVLKVSKSLGFRTYYDPDGYYGYAEIGQGTEMIGILGHVDVVPAEDLDKWVTHPFDPTVRHGKIYGRGTQDDKGPMLAALYAVSALNDSGLPFNKRIRFIFGTDEETLWRGINAYKEKEELPSYGFSPDSKFPLIYAEKALIQVKLMGDGMSGVVIDAGEAFNSVPSKAIYQGKMRVTLEKALDKLGFEYDSLENEIWLKGKSVHAQVAENGINAASRLCIALNQIKNSNEAIQFVSEQLSEDVHGENIFGAIEDAISGKLKINLGKMKINALESELCLDLRVPVTADVEEIKGYLRFSRILWLDYIEHDYLRSIHVSKDSSLVKTLMGAYQKVTGDLESKPMTAGGATFARALDKCVAFGSVFPGRPKTEHQPNEHISLGDLKMAMLIYAEAVIRLLKTDIN